jgi:DNA invertase Pin-like site-specific DNA recombinase
MLIGYARTSTREQVAGFEAQLTAFTELGCEKVFKEQTSAVKVREQLQAAIDFAREGDVLVVTKLDRLARSVADLCKIVEELDKKGVSLRILNMHLDTSTPTGKLMLNLIGSIAQFEREMMLERQKDGIAAAKESGKYKGRQPTAKAKAGEVVVLAAQGMTRDAIAKQLNIGVASVYRILSAAAV